MGLFLTLFFLAGALLLQDLLPKPEQENAKPKNLGDFQFPTATEGRPIPMLWGTRRNNGPNVIWYDDLVQDAITEKVKTGLFSSERVVRGFKYSVGFQMSLGLGELDAITRIWIGEELVWDSVNGTDPEITDGDTFTIDKPELFGGDDLGNGGVVGTLKFFAGSSTQTASTYLETFQGPNAPAYVGEAYVCPDSEPIYIGNSTQIQPWSFETRRVVNGLSLGSGHENVNSGDMNPANVLYEALTDTDWGKGIGASDIDTAQWTGAAGTLFAEGNGFSFLLDREIEVEDLIKFVTDQADATVTRDPSDGLWKFKLTRNDYTIGTVPAINDTNLLEVAAWDTGTWVSTINEVRVPFADRNDSYKETYGFAPNLANHRIVGRSKVVEVTHPGVGDGDLASALALRELRTLSRPVPQGTLVVDRSLYDVRPGDVVSLTNAKLGATLLPLRVKDVKGSGLRNGAIRLEVSEDVFQAQAGITKAPDPTTWVPPVDTLVAYPAGEQLVFEAPRLMTLRDGSAAPEVDKLFAAARRQGNETVFDVRERHAVGTPAGAFATVATGYAFQRIGELASALPTGSSYPQASLQIVPTPDTQSAIETAFPDVTDLVELGTELVSLCYIESASGGEFILVESAQNNASNVQLNNVWRGVGDSVQLEHASGSSVYLLFVGSVVSDDTIPAGDNVDVKLIPRSASATLAEASATTIALVMSNRTRRPNPPSSFDLNNVTLDTTSVNLDGSGSGESAGVLFDEIVRRDFRTVNEIEALQTDAATLFADFPTANSTTHALIVANGSTVLVNQSIGSGTSGTVTQLDILQALDTTSLPASLTFGVRATHTFEGTSYDSLDDAQVLATVDSDFVGDHAFGALDTNDVSALYEVASGDDSTDHDFTLSTSFTAGDVEYRLDGGSWTTLISAGGTSGSIANASLSVGTDIEIRHLSSDVSAQKLLTMDVGGTVKAYAVAFT